MPRKKFKPCEGIIFEPQWAKKCPVDPKHPLVYGELVYFLGEIPNVPGHCLVAKYTGEVVCMVHPEDFRRAKESEL